MLNSNLLCDSVTDASSVTSEFCVINGWDSNVTNVPDNFKNTWGILITIWRVSTKIGSLDGSRFQALIDNQGNLYARYHNGTKWYDWYNS